MGISRQNALDCFKSGDLIGIGMEADAIRGKLHPENVVTYAIGGKINFTESEPNIFNKIQEIADANGTGIALYGKPGPTHTAQWFENLFKSIKTRFPALCLQGLAPTEITEIAGLSNLTIPGTLALLKDAGLDSISAGADIALHRTAHKLGMQTTVNIAFGSGESFEQSIGNLESIYRIQEETNGFKAFALSSQVTANQSLEAPTAVEHLKTLAIARIFLDNIENVQSSPQMQGLKVLQVTFRFGGNDVTLMHPEATTEEELRQVIRNAGFRPAQRDTLYRTMFLN